MSRHRWTPADDDLIDRLVGDHRTEFIARRLGLSVSQVNNRIAVLGLSRKRTDVYSANELSGILGIEGNWIRSSLIATGLMRSTRSSSGRFGRTQVTERDLIAFLREYPHLVDRDRVDVVYRQYLEDRWITTAEAFRRGANHPVVLEHAFLSGLLEEVRKRGMRWVIPEAVLPRLVAGRRRFTDDVEHRRQVRMYDRLQARGALGALARSRPKLRRSA